MTKSVFSYASFQNDDALVRDFLAEVRAHGHNSETWVGNDQLVQAIQRVLIKRQDDYSHPGNAEIRKFLPYLITWLLEAELIEVEDRSVRNKRYRVCPEVEPEEVEAVVVDDNSPEDPLLQNLLRARAEINEAIRRRRKELRSN